jgi:hypothetical protein
MVIPCFDGYDHTPEGRVAHGSHTLRIDTLSTTKGTPEDEKHIYILSIRFFRNTFRSDRKSLTVACGPPLGRMFWGWTKDDAAAGQHLALTAFGHVMIFVHERG